MLRGQVVSLARAKVIHFPQSSCNVKLTMQVIIVRLLLLTGDKVNGV